MGEKDAPDTVTCLCSSLCSLLWQSGQWQHLMQQSHHCYISIKPKSPPEFSGFLLLVQRPLHLLAFRTSWFWSSRLCSHALLPFLSWPPPRSNPTAAEEPGEGCCGVSAEGNGTCSLLPFRWAAACPKKCCEMQPV